MARLPTRKLIAIIAILIFAPVGVKLFEWEWKALFAICSEISKRPPSDEQMRTLYLEHASMLNDIQREAEQDPRSDFVINANEAESTDFQKAFHTLRAEAISKHNGRVSIDVYSSGMLDSTTTKSLVYDRSPVQASASTSTAKKGSSTYVKVAENWYIELSI